MAFLEYLQFLLWNTECFHIQFKRLESGKSLFGWISHDSHPHYSNSPLFERITKPEGYETVNDSSYKCQTSCFYSESLIPHAAGVCCLFLVGLSCVRELLTCYGLWLLTPPSRLVTAAWQSGCARLIKDSDNKGNRIQVHHMWTHFSHCFTASVRWKW